MTSEKGIDRTATPPTVDESASQLVKFAVVCNRRWAFEKVLGEEDPAGRPAALGTEVHTLHEGYNLKAEVPNPKQPWAYADDPNPDDPKVSYPGRIMLNMMPAGIYPKPRTGHTEHNFRLPLDGIIYNGKIDWHGVVSKGGAHWVKVIDHKTSSDPVKYGNTDETLRHDPQALLYAWAVLQMYPTTVGVDLYWNYGHSGGIKKHSRVAHTRFTRAEAEAEFLELLHPTGLELRRLRLMRVDPMSLEPNPQACHMWHKACPRIETCNLTTEQRIGHLFMSNDLMNQLLAGAPPTPAAQAVPLPAQPPGAQVNPPDVAPVLPLAPVAAPVAVVLPAAPSAVAPVTALAPAGLAGVLAPPTIPVRSASDQAALDVLTRVARAAGPPLAAPAAAPAGTPAAALLGAAGNLAPPAVVTQAQTMPPPHPAQAQDLQAIAQATRQAAREDPPPLADAATGVATAKALASPQFAHVVAAKTAEIVAAQILKHLKL